MILTPVPPRPRIRWFAGIRPQRQSGRLARLKTFLLQDTSPALATFRFCLRPSRLCSPLPPLALEHRAASAQRRESCSRPAPRHQHFFRPTIVCSTVFNAGLLGQRAGFCSAGGGRPSPSVVPGGSVGLTRLSAAGVGASRPGASPATRCALGLRPWSRPAAGAGAGSCCRGRFPGAPGVWALPFLTRLAPSARGPQRRKQQHKSLLDGGRPRLKQGQRWHLGRRSRLVVASADAALEFWHRGTGWRHPIPCLTRLRRKTAL
jgi:hypothetical protein